MHIHILGICGTFMGSLAQLAKSQGHRVTGSDANVYPPMSTQLEQAGIEVQEGFDVSHLQPAPDLVVVGNAMSRGNEAVEYVLNKGLPYTSGPAYLSNHLLKDKWVMAVAGTHGKTTTTSMLAWVLEDCGFQPGFLIGGVPKNFGVSARLGESDFFVVEADEYDSAFFDKRSKFVHYHGRTVILNNMEFDHADIFKDLDAIKTQFHHLVRTIPSEGQIIFPANDANIKSTLDMGCWTPTVTLGGDWRAELKHVSGSVFEVYQGEQLVGEVRWKQTGQHNVNNALACIAAAHHVGILPKDSIAALNRFVGVKRRMELICDAKEVKIYDDFAHHPTAIESTLAGMANSGEFKRIRAVIEPRSNTMRMGVHKAELPKAVEQADEIIWFQPKGLNWDMENVVEQCNIPNRVNDEPKSVLFDDIDAIIAHLVQTSEPGDGIVLMSNGGFGGIHKKLAEAMSS
ncbi:UDP-N-acetylmuramate:L-alanyl-gamma-D-glutamyl-meso-diaminopimelate ligase [Bermanella marisrubri]|uniref:UDP-N-acetylmuramate--L-alanyl-gamma-D-glutamyl-meso-2,6-diaminoheptandioate ligase n=1 Tax=Bermanella marisrubri TaxID=207949 RepID=Q1N0F9_9GAMM|nr:UDP-N-acetylmuramate:L-alanyl-gamma-D-glutamyl-meso-diaminopimelate ligase [Bermanella marisrubri]EAT11705.1 UDP-N-acetylmuramate:L-alanyl-gamma-D-glutamyl-meso-diaminopimelate ligase [Oceanobacter sp. RED65] [Bermanella marisrubri]QIZ83260.1 UDP-N-acetylmuramate:L-alanyl-gamma-D-glutamyl-meso-diaminopimelate ligase [Bermanella marisrubri]